MKELAIFGICLAVGILGLPSLAFVVGQVVLGPYTGGGFGNILTNEFRGLATGAISSWIIALSPYVTVQIVRLIWNCDSVRTRIWPERDRLDPEHGVRPEDE